MELTMAENAIKELLQIGQRHFCTTLMVALEHQIKVGGSATRLMAIMYLHLILMGASQGTHQQQAGKCLATAMSTHTCPYLLAAIQMCKPSFSSYHQDHLHHIGSETNGICWCLSDAPQLDARWHVLVFDLY